MKVIAIFPVTIYLVNDKTYRVINALRAKANLVSRKYLSLLKKDLYIPIYLATIFFKFFLLGKHGKQATGFERERQER